MFKNRGEKLTKQEKDTLREEYESFGIVMDFSSDEETNEQEQKFVDNDVSLSLGTPQVFQKLELCEIKVKFI